MLKFLPLFLIVFSTNVLSENQSSILEGPTLEVIGITPVPGLGVSTDEKAIRQLYLILK